MKYEYSAGAVIYSASGTVREFLFLRREEGWLDMPKGHIEKGETAEQAAIREIREETGIEAKLDPNFRYESIYWYNREGNRIKKSVKFFLAEAVQERRVKVSSEHVGHE